MNGFSDLKNYAKQLVRLAVHKAGSGRLASSFTGIAESELSRYASDVGDGENRHIPLYLWLALDEAGGDSGLKELARRRGYDLISREQKEQLSECVTKLAGKATVAQAELVSIALEAISDGKIDAGELRDVRRAKMSVVDTAEQLFEGVQGLTDMRRVRAG
jgi:hypothetical protein